MNRRTPSPPVRTAAAASDNRRQLEALQKQAGAWWTTRTARERRLLIAGALAVAATLIWVIGLQPAASSISRSLEQLPRLHADAAQVDALILEAHALQRRQSGQIDAADLSQALREDLRRGGLEASATLSELGAAGAESGPQWQITVTDAGATPTMDWLAGLPYRLGVQIHRVELSRSRVEGRDRPGHVTGRIVLQQLQERPR